MARSGLLLLALLATAPVFADALDISPTRIQMLGPERTATLSIRNSSTAPANIQVRAMDWAQADGTDQYAPSSVLLASPPQAALAPGEAQVIRLVIDKLPPGTGERAFRLVIDQIPSGAAAGGAGVRTSIRALVPVFVTPSATDRPSLRWQAARGTAGIMLSVSNQGGAHDRLIDGHVTVAGKSVGRPIEGYVLAGGQRRWTIAGVPAGASSLTLTGEGEFGQVRADVPITP